MQYCFRYRDVFYDYQRGLNPEWNRYSPGHLLLAHAMREAIAEGAREFDLLRGVEPYKFSWTDTVRTDSRILFSTEWPGHLWSLGATVYDGAAAVAKAILPDTAQQKLGQLMVRS
jgi:CelD/BcsL family acetyltransferase involved in cellulose biosynthesis